MQNYLKIDEKKFTRKPYIIYIKNQLLILKIYTQSSRIL